MSTRIPRSLAIIVAALGLAHSASAQIVVSPGSPYVEDFEGGAGGWVSSGLWTFGDPGTWTHGGHQIAGTSSGTQGWYFGINGTYPHGAEGMLTSPVFDFSGLTADPLLELSLAFAIRPPTDGVRLEIDRGQGFEVYGPVGRNNGWYEEAIYAYMDFSNPNPFEARAWTNGSLWGARSTRLTDVAGRSNVRFRLRFKGDPPSRIRPASSFEKGLCFDDFSIRPVSYEANKPNASMHIDGLQTNGTFPAVTSVPSMTSVTLSRTGAIAGLPMETVFNFAPLAARGSAGAVALGSGQILNLDTSASSLGFLNGGAQPVMLPMANSSLPLVVPPGFQVSTQMVVLDFTSPDLLALSQACELIGQTFQGQTVAGPTQDDEVVPLSLLSAPFTFHGNTYTDLRISSNGRLVFGATDHDPTAPAVQHSPNLAHALRGNAFVGFWTDLNPSAGGTITAVETLGRLTLSYVGVPYYGDPNRTATFDIILHLDGFPNAGTVEITNLSQTQLPGREAMLGMSAGRGVATDPGSMTFTPGTSGTTSAPTDMRYAMHGWAGHSTGIELGLDRIAFTPQPSGYAWTAN